MSAQLNQNWLPRIRENFRSKPIGELARIYARQDTDEWSPEAFDVIREIFHARNLPLPPIVPRATASTEKAAAPTAKPLRSASFQGIGTMLIGKRDFYTDGSYITTQWFVLFFVPMFPIRSLRVCPTGSGERRSRFGFGWRESYTVYAQTSPNLKQVLSVYLFTVLWFCSVVSVICWDTARQKNGDMDSFALLLAVSLPFLIPFTLRYYARR